MYEDTVNCDASLTQIVSQHFCEIPMTKLRATALGTDYGLVYNDLIVATVSAYNSLGWSAPSP
jgi:hypothetical protein